MLEWAPSGPHVVEEREVKGLLEPFQVSENSRRREGGGQEGRRTTMTDQ